jgi:RNA polymerase sigma factor (sigma-70 family)
MTGSSTLVEQGARQRGRLPAPASAADRAQTALMDRFRRTGSPRVFEALATLATPHLERRVKSRIRYLGGAIDPQEVLQDTLVNIFRYPDRFDGRRPSAFRAWSATIVDNTIRRHLRRALSGPDVQLQPVELLCNEPDAPSRGPEQRAIQSEACVEAIGAMRLLLGCYLAAYDALSPRERFALQMVEVDRVRYAALAELLGMRAEAVKMVVFRARRRIHERMSTMLKASTPPRS